MPPRNVGVTGGNPEHLFDISAIAPFLPGPLSAIGISVVLLEQTVQISLACSEDSGRSLPVAAAMIQDRRDMTPFDFGQGDVRSGLA